MVRRRRQRRLREKKQNGRWFQSIPRPLRWAALGGAAALVVGLAILLPHLWKKSDKPGLTPGAIIDSAKTAITGSAADISYLQREAKIRYNAINEPYKYGNDIVFSATSGSISYTRLVIYHTDTQESDTIPAKVRYNNLTGLVMNDRYIAYLDASSGGGGRVCVYDRETAEFRTIKEYAYAMPKLSLSGDYLAFLQQAGETTDRLYVCNLRTGETVTPKVFEGAVDASGGAHLNGTVLTYAVGYYEGDLLKSRVTTLDLSSGAEESYDWDRLVYSPMRSGKYIAFLSSASGAPDDVYLSENGAQPQLLASDVTNLRMGDGFLAYTKEDAVYAYVFETGKSYRMNTTVSKALLASVCGRGVCWYDVTSYSDVDIVKYADMEW